MYKSTALLKSLSLCYHLAVVSAASHSPKVLFSVSEHTAKYPIFGIAIFDNLILPPNCSTLAEYSSTDETPIELRILH